MKIPKKIDNFRRGLMKSLTRNIGNSTYKAGIDKKVEIKKILISRPNHRLGNLLLLTPLVQEVIDTFPDCKIDLFVKGSIAPIVFKNYKSVDRIIQLPKKPFSNIGKYAKGWLLIKTRKYDLVINANQGSSSGRLSTSFSNSTYKFFGESDEASQLKYPDYRHNAKQPIYNFRHYLTRMGFDQSEKAIPFLDIKLEKEEIEKGRNILNAIVSNNKQTICLFTNATGTKRYSETWWNDFHGHLETAFPDHNIIELLPVENTSQLNFKIPTYYSTDIREMGAFIANTKIFIAADNGVMHLASAVQAPTVGLFSVTDENVYKPYNTNSLSINTNETGHLEIVDLIRDLLAR